MLTEAYIDALLVDQELADQVWELWEQREIDDQVAMFASLTLRNLDNYLVLR